MNRKGSIQFVRPAWVIEKERVDKRASYRTPEDQMELVLAYSRQNLREETGGPFASAIFGPHGELVVIGTNMVIEAQNLLGHALLVAMANRCMEAGTSHFHADERGPLTMACVCEPCIGCAGFLAGSGIQSLVYGASGHVKEDVLEMEQGGEAALHLEKRGLTIVRGVMAHEAKRLLTEAKSGDCFNYNPKLT